MYKTTCDCRHIDVLQKSERNDMAWREWLNSSIGKGAHGSQQEGPAVP